MLASLLLGLAPGVDAAALQPGDGACTPPHWPPPAVVKAWPHDGERERCFCAYSQLASGGDISSLTAACPSWPDFVSTDGVTPDRVHAAGALATASATVLGSRDGNASAVGHPRYGPMSDWAIDLGSGYGEDCDPSLSPGCAAVGTHLLSIPRARFYLDCCTHPTLSLAAALRAGEGAAVCATLREMVGGALAQIQPDELASYDSCRAEDEEPALPGRCLAQCFHIVPDVYMAHLHTTAAAARQRNGPVNSGLGPQFNASQAADAPLHGRYNACACEPSSWADVTPGRGHCPAERPADAGYPAAAAATLCKNIAGIAGLPAESCDACDGGNNSRMSVELR